MFTKTKLTMLVIFLATACTDRSGILGTKVGRQMPSSRSSDPDQILGDAVFSLIKDQTKEQAIQTLQKDGAACDTSTCTWLFVERETWLDTLGVRMPSPRQTFEKTWSVTILGDVVVNRGDVVSQLNITRTE